jgi:hypothetical protein
MKGYVVNVYAPFIRACEKLLYKTSHNNFSGRTPLTGGKKS